MWGGVVTWAFIVLRGEWVRLRMRVALGLFVVALFGGVTWLSLAVDAPAVDRCTPPFPGLRETWLIDRPECVGRP